MKRKPPASSTGTCQTCRGSHPRELITAHLGSCLDRTAQAAKRKPVDAFHIEAEGFNYTTGSLYWLHAIARSDATFLDLDKLLRTTWLEPCCGHMSSFEMGSRRFETYPDDEFGPPSESMKDASLAAALAPGKTLEYQYDFGSTTELALRVVARRPAALKGRSKAQVLAINDPPALACVSCGTPATLVCATGCEADEALSCRACAPDHECGEDMLSSLVNSPRTGVCGYPTEPVATLGAPWETAR